MVRSFLAALLLVALVGGCPGGASTTPAGPAAECTTRGAQCKLKDGLLGVCSEIECGAGKAPPCLACMAQH